MGRQLNIIAGCPATRIGLSSNDFRIDATVMSKGIYSFCFRDNSFWRPFELCRQFQQKEQIRIKASVSVATRKKGLL